MSLKTTNKIATNRYELEVEVGAEAFEEAVEKAYRKGVKRINIAGFRPGKAPRSVIEKMYGKEFFYEDAVNDIYAGALEEAIVESGLETIKDEIGLEVVSVGAEGLVFKAQLTTKPEIEVTQYKGLEAENKDVILTEDMVDEEINKVRERNSRMISVEDRAAKNGDTAVFDFEGSVDGEVFEGGTAEAFSLVLGSGQFIPGFEEQMVGHNIGEEFDVNVTFPEEYHSEDLAGKEAVFKIKLHELKEKELPELDDEFAKDVSEFDTLEEYRNDVRKNLEEKAEKDARDFFLGNVQTALIEKIEGEIPEAMYENRVDEMIHEFSHNLQHQGLDMDTYLKYTGMDEKALRGNFKANAERQVKLRLALEKVAKIEDIKTDEAEIDAELTKLGESYKMDLETVKKAVDVNLFELELAMEKAMKIVEESAIIKAGE